GAATGFALRPAATGSSSTGPALAGTKSFITTGSWKLATVAASDRLSGTAGSGSRPAGPNAAVDSDPSAARWRITIAPSVAWVARVRNRSSDTTASGSDTGSLSAAEVRTIGSTFSTDSRN